MTVTVTCPDCDKTLRVKDESAGKKIRCPACSTVFPVPARSTNDDDDYLNDLEPVKSPKRKRRSADDDFDDEDEPVAAPRSRKSKSSKKKSGKGQSGGTNWVLIGSLTGGGLIAVFFLAMLVASIGQARKAAAIHQANWPTFKHPSGLAQVDMPGVPTLTDQLSQNGRNTYSLSNRNYQVSLTAVTMLPDAQLRISTNPAALEIIFKEMETRIPQQIPGGRLISSSRLTAGTSRGLEMKLAATGSACVMRFYFYPNSIVSAEFVSRKEDAFVSDRDRFFSSLRGPDGNLMNGQAQSAVGNATPAAAPSTDGAGQTSSARSLTDARRALQTKLVRNVQGDAPAPKPPGGRARRVRYDAPSGALSAYVTTIPKDGNRHPAIVWVHGGDCNSIHDGFFEDAPANNDQTAGAFRKGGVVTMYASLRGGNDNPGFKEGFLGEVDDVLAAADFLSKQDGINPDRIYLGGHSTGGTLALLAAESTNRFRAIFSFGPVDDIRRYGEDFLFFDQSNPAEIEVRTPSRWFDSVKNRTFVLEGMLQPGNLSSLQAMSKVSRNPLISFVAAPRADHFNILAPVTKLIAEKIVRDDGPVTNITLTESDLNLNFAQ